MHSPYHGQVLQLVIYHRLKSRTDLQTQTLVNHTDVIRSAKTRLVLKKEKKSLIWVHSSSGGEQFIH